MTEQLDKLAAMVLIVALPLSWGLVVEFVFELLRRRNIAPGLEEVEDL